MTSTQPTKVTTFSLPRGARGGSIVIVTLIMLLSSRRELLAPGYPLYDNLLSTRPTALKYAKYVQNGLFYFLFGAHSIETALFAVKLHKAGLTPMQMVWWKWMGLCFCGGIFCYEEWEKVAKREGAKRL